MRISMLGVLFATTLLAGAAFAQDETMNPTQARMRGVFLTLTTAYRYSLDPVAFEDPQNEGSIRSTLQALVANAGELEAHGGGLDPSFDYLRRSLARDANDALERFDQRQYVGSRFLLTKLTENCVTCHSKLPQKHGYELGAKFLDEANVKDLPPIARVDIEIATRQFKRALGTYEKIFADPEEKPQTLSLVGAFEEYLRLCVGVVNETDRAVKTLAKFKTRSDVPSNLSALCAAWMADLESLDLTPAKDNELFVARGMIEEARASKRFAEDRTPLVDFIAAASLLHQYLQAGTHGRNEEAEALYLLAVAESNISRSYWVSETSSLLEQAIGAAPKSAVAKQAYAFLEEYTLSGQAVTAREVPENVQAKLDSLRTMIEK
jgi:hypothetical protein